MEQENKISKKEIQEIIDKETADLFGDVINEVEPSLEENVFDQAIKVHNSEELKLALDDNEEAELSEEDLSSLKKTEDAVIYNLEINDEPPTTIEPRPFSASRKDFSDQHVEKVVINANSTNPLESTYQQAVDSYNEALRKAEEQLKKERLLKKNKSVSPGVNRGTFKANFYNTLVNPMKEGKESTQLTYTDKSTVNSKHVLKKRVTLKSYSHFPKELKDYTNPKSDKIIDKRNYKEVLTSIFTNKKFFSYYLKTACESELAYGADTCIVLLEQFDRIFNGKPLYARSCGSRGQDYVMYYLIMDLLPTLDIEGNIIEEDGTQFYKFFHKSEAEEDRKKELDAIVGNGKYLEISATKYK